MFFSSHGQQIDAQLRSHVFVPMCWQLFLEQPTWSKAITGRPGLVSVRPVTDIDLAPSGLPLAVLASVIPSRAGSVMLYPPSREVC